MEEYTPRSINKYLQTKHTNNIYCFTQGEADSWAVKWINISSEQVLQQIIINNSFFYYNNLGTLTNRLDFHSFMFPDGRVWDSSKKGFRDLW